MLIQDNNNGVRFRNHLFSEGQALHQIARHRRGVIPRRSGACPLFFINFAADEMHRDVSTIQREGHGDAGGNYRQLTNNVGLLVTERDHLRDIRIFACGHM
ncbi:hypothetical protein D3C72_2012680 [compost metagenome]